MPGRRPSLATTGIVGCVAFVGLAAACSGLQEERAAPPPATTVPPSPAKAPTPTREPKPEPAEEEPQKVPKTFDRKHFARTLTDVNEFVPLVPGLQSVSKGSVYVGDRLLPHIRVTTITDVTKRIDGVLAVLVLDQDFDGGQLSEQSIDYLAEDVGGNVWYMGSYTEVYEGGQFLNSEDAWLAGVNGAVPGL